MAHYATLCYPTLDRKCSRQPVLSTALTAVGVWTDSNWPFWLGAVLSLVLSRGKRKRGAMLPFSHLTATRNHPGPRGRQLEAGREAGGGGRV